MKLPLTRKEALEVGSKFYITNKPCKHGHNSKRYTSSKGCYECVKSTWDEANIRKKVRYRKNWVQELLKRKNYILQATYNMSFIDYRNLVASQNYKCPLCLTEETFMENYQYRNKAKGYLGDLVVDHCHESGEVRGALCQDCNRALGGFKDDINILSRAIKYLERYK